MTAANRPLGGTAPVVCPERLAHPSQDTGALSGSRPSGHAADGVDGGSRFDPARLALEEAVYVIRNAAGVSDWHRLHGSRPFDYEDFCVWADHWALAHPVVTIIAALQDRDTLLRAESAPVDPSESTGQ